MPQHTLQIVITFFFNSPCGKFKRERKGLGRPTCPRHWMQPTEEGFFSICQRYSRYCLLKCFVFLEKEKLLHLEVLKAHFILHQILGSWSYKNYPVLVSVSKHVFSTASLTDNQNQKKFSINL